MARGWVLITSHTGCLTTARSSRTRAKCGVSRTDNRT